MEKGCSRRCVNKRMWEASTQKEGGWVKRGEAEHGVPPPMERTIKQVNRQSTPQATPPSNPATPPHHRQAFLQAFPHLCRVAGSGPHRHTVLALADVHRHAADHVPSLVQDLMRHTGSACMVRVWCVVCVRGGGGGVWVNGKMPFKKQQQKRKKKK
jgi:hypothetical protein